MIFEDSWIGLISSFSEGAYGHRLHQCHLRLLVAASSFDSIVKYAQVEKSQLRSRKFQNLPRSQQGMVDVGLQFEIRQEVHEVCC